MVSKSLILGVLAGAFIVSARAQLVFNWANTSGGAWETGANWAGASVPNAIGDEGVIAAAGTYTVTLSSSFSIYGFILNNASATLQVASTAPTFTGLATAITAGTLALNSGQISASNGAVPYTFANAGTITSLGTSFIQGGTFGMAFTNTGQISVNGGTMTLGAGANDIITNAPGGTITANGGTLTLNGGTSSILNTGTIVAQAGGVVNFGGNFLTSGLGTIQGAGGTLNLTGKLNNALATLAAPSTGIFTLDTGTISGGTVDYTSTPVIAFSTAGGTLDGVSMLGNLTVPVNQSFTAKDGTTFASGTTTFGGNSLHLNSANTALTIASSASWTGDFSITGQIAGAAMVNSGTLAPTSGGDVIDGGGSTGFTFTNSSSGVVAPTGTGFTLGQGATDTIVNAGLIETNGGNILILNAGTDTLSNSGTIDANGTGQTITIGNSSTDSWTNKVGPTLGTLEATNGGKILLGGTFQPINLTQGTITAATGGVVGLSGTLANNTTLEAPDGGGVFTLAGGTISGGIVDNTVALTPALTFSTSGGVLDGVTMNGTFSLPTSSFFTAEDGTTFNSGTTTFNSNAVRLNSANTALTIASTATWTGDFSIISQIAGAAMVNNGTLAPSANGDLFYGGGSTGFTFTNSSTGVIEPTGLNFTLGQGGTDAIVNAGLIETNGGNILILNSGTETLTNSGTINANGTGQTITIGNSTSDTWTNKVGSTLGTLEATNGGKILLGGTFLPTNLTEGTITAATGGVVGLSGTLASNTTLEAPNGGGIFTLAGGTISGGIVDNTVTLTPALTFSTSGGILDGVTMNGAFTLPTSSFFTAEDGTTFNSGTTTFNANTIRLGTANTALTIASTATWTGDFSVNGQVTGASMVNNGTLTPSANGDLIDGGGSTGFTFTNSSTGVIEPTASNFTLGQGGTDAIVNAGLIETNGGNILILNAGTGDSLTNSGTIEANGTGQTITVGNNSTDTWTNKVGSTLGTLEATNGGKILLGGTFLPINLTQGTITAATGGVVGLSGTLSANTTLEPPDGGGVFTLAGGTISGGIVDNTVSLAPALTFSTSGGILDGVTMNGTFTLPTSSFFTAEDGTTFNSGTTTFNANTVRLGTANTALTIASTATWTGDFSVNGQVTGASMENNGTLTPSANGDLIDGGGSTGFMFTNSVTGVIEPTASNFTLGQGGTDAIVNAGLIETNGGNILILNAGTGDSLTNSGTIDANGAGQTITIGNNGTDTWTNKVGSTLGTLEATNGGKILLGGTFLPINLTQGTITDGTSSEVGLSGTLSNNTTLEAPNGGGIFTLAGGTISGGIVDNTVALTPALTFSTSGGILDGVTMNGTFTLPTSSFFTAEDGTTFNSGTTTFNANTVRLGTANTALTIASTATWTGDFSVNGQIAGAAMVNNGTLTPSANGDLIDGGGSTGFTFTNSVTGVIEPTASNFTLGQGGTDAIVNAGLIETNGGNILILNAGTGDSLTNSGTIEASGTGQTITIGNNSTDTWTNKVGSTPGTIEATNGGTVLLGGTFQPINLTQGTIIAGTGSKVGISGTLANNTTLEAPDGGGVFTLAAGTINGGIVDNTSTPALTFGSSGGILNGVTMNGDFTLPSSAFFTADNGTTFNSGTTTFVVSTIRLGSANTALTIASGATWTGGVSVQGQIAGASFVNNGTFVSSTGGDFIDGGGSTGFTFTNNGLVEATSGNLNVGQGGTDLVTNGAGGTMEANGGTLTFDTSASTVSNVASSTLTGGTWEAINGGTIQFNTNTNPIVTNAALIVLSGPSSTFRTQTGAGSSYQTLEQTLTTNNGSLQLLGSRGFASTSSGFTNNGTILLVGGTFTAPSLTLGGSSTLAGTGTFNPTGGVTVAGGASLSPGSTSSGNFVGTLSFNSLALGANSSVTFDVTNAPSTAGLGYDTLAVTGVATVTATNLNPFTISLRSIDPGTGAPGLATFNAATPYQWTLLSASSITGFSSNDFSITTGSFSNSLAGGNFSVTSNGTDIFLDFTPVPEPSTWALMALGAGAIGFGTWRRRAAPARASSS